MIYIFMALMAEAKPLIHALDLKKDKSKYQYNVYENTDKNIRLIISGVGQINMAVCVSHILTEYKASKKDMVCNIGSCAGNREGTFIINKLIEETTKRTFFPDMLYKNDFEENTLLSGMNIADTKKENVLYDMEGAAFYQSAVKYVNEDRISLVKCVSDNFDSKEVNADKLANLTEKEVARLVSYIEGLIYIVDDEPDKSILDATYLDKVAADMHLSVTLKEQLKHILMFAKLSNKEYESVINKYYQNSVLPCKDKKEGKLILNELQEKLL